MMIPVSFYEFTTTTAADDVSVFADMIIRWWAARYPVCGSLICRSYHPTPWRMYFYIILQQTVQLSLAA